MIRLLMLFTVSAFGDVALVDVRDVDATIRVKLRYATAENELKHRLNPDETCLVGKPVADALARVQSSLRLRSQALQMRDCYRPVSLEAPVVGTAPLDGVLAHRHTRGLSVDVALVDNAGVEVGEPEVKPAKRIKRDRRRAQKQTAFLRSAMEKEGFVADPKSFWHYDFKGWEVASPLDVPLPLPKEK